MIKIAPSILSSDFTKMDETILAFNQAGADYIHIDVMDGNFVDQITFGHKMVADIRPHTKLPLDVHLMIIDPMKHIDSFVEAGADLITIHEETCDDLVSCVEQIRSKGVSPSISIKPDTSVDAILSILPLVDMVLVMTVVPGQGGQSLIPSTLDKVSELYSIKQENDYKYDIQVDGGINTHTAKLAISAGANVLVAGSAITCSDDYSAAIASLRANK